MEDISETWCDVTESDNDDDVASSDVTDFDILSSCDGLAGTVSVVVMPIPSIKSPAGTAELVLSKRPLVDADSGIADSGDTLADRTTCWVWAQLWV